MKVLLTRRGLGEEYVSAPPEIDAWLLRKELLESIEEQRREH